MHQKLAVKNWHRSECHPPLMNDLIYVKKKKKIRSWVLPFAIWIPATGLILMHDKTQVKIENNLLRGRKRLIKIWPGYPTNILPKCFKIKFLNSTSYLAQIHQNMAKFTLCLIIQFANRSWSFILFCSFPGFKHQKCAFDTSWIYNSESFSLE